MSFQGLTSVDVESMAFFSVLLEESEPRAMRLRIMHIDKSLLYAIADVLDTHCGCCFASSDEGHPLSGYTSLQWMVCEGSTVGPIDELYVAISHMQQ